MLPLMMTMLVVVLLLLLLLLLLMALLLLHPAMVPWETVRHQAEWSRCWPL